MEPVTQDFFGKFKIFLTTTGNQYIDNEIHFLETSLFPDRNTIEEKRGIFS